MKKFILSGFQFVIYFFVFLLATASGKPAVDWVIAPDTTKTVDATTQLNNLTIEDNANLIAPDGYTLTLTVDGVETGQVLKTWEGVDYKFAPGTYQGDIVLTVAEAHQVPWENAGGGEAQGTTTLHPFRQALYLDTDGIDYNKSVLAAVKGEKPEGFEIKNISIESKGTFYKDPTSPGGTGFNGIFAADGNYYIKDVKIDFFGDGRSDFAAQGTAIVASGKGTRLVLDDVTINTQGIVRSGVIATGGSNLIVKNSDIQVKNGVLPPVYVGTMDTSQMRSTLWISGMTGTTRATNVIGPGTVATYINSHISFEGWGGLSTDGARDSKLFAINCKIDSTGDSGYGHYNNGGCITRILGCEFNVATLGSGMDSGFVYFGDSTREAVDALNQELGLGLTYKELNGISVKPTIINSEFQGLLWHAGGTAVTITGGTIINTKDTIFVVKGCAADIQLDGSQGARLNPGNGVIMQVMDDDEPPYDRQTGAWDDYEEPTGPVTKDASHDISIAEETDALANFSNTEIKGDFYNSARGGQKDNPNPSEGGTVSGSKNLGLTFDNARITGVISASDARHYYNGQYYPRIGKDDILVFNRVINTPGPAVNNGVVVTLTGDSNWTVTGTSYLSKLVVEEGSDVIAPSGRTLTMTVDDGEPITDIAAGSYTGNIVIRIN